MDFMLIHPGALAEITLNVVILSVLIHQVFSPALLTAFLRSSNRFDQKPENGSLSPNNLEVPPSLEAAGR